ncbi:carbohydrate ABC transporter permease [Microbacterium sp. MYb45]|uniref:carbohydrate ABC transporter permease n=1 Tax=Microbacterium sp. MYb45 TaxID=1827294 RepID=UPI000CFF086F|nr:sugar ABC transporter permease [Microbacterium sp. MYb45]PRB65669.1 ABC transporter permease [Microbacterium sp. MYb45]
MSITTSDSGELATSSPAARRGRTTESSTPAPTGARRRGRAGRRLRIAGLLFVLPAAVYIVGFQLVPVVYGLVLSFTNYSPVARGNPDVVGGSNYVAILTDPQFLNSLLVTGKYVLLVLPVLLVLALGLAMLVNRPFKGIGVFRSMLYVPHIVSLTAVSIIWLWLYSNDGAINQLLGAFGLDPQAWLLDADTALPAVAVMRIWKALGSNMVLLLAGLQTIPSELYEAARMDGAGPWARFRYVTLPGLRPILLYVVATDIIFLAQSFAEMFVMTKGGPLGSTTVANYLIYNEAFQYNQMGSASAMAFVLFALVAAFSLLAVRSFTRRSS